jgi:two-component system, cell cycle sensor histidine kinase and response regulator CckA
VVNKGTGKAGTGQTGKITATRVPVWQHPPYWGGAAGVLAGAAVIVAQAAPHLVGLTVLLALLAVGGLIGLAWILGRTGAVNPIADLLYAAAETSPNAYLITRGDGPFVYANPAFHRLFSFAVSLDAIADIVGGGEEGRNEFARLRASASAGVGDHGEVPLRFSPRGSTGEVEWRRISVTPLRGNRRLVLWQATDVTASREFDAVRRREEELLADFVDHLPAGFFSADAQGRIQFVNQTLADWLQVPAADLLGNGKRFSDFVVADKSTPALNGEGGDDLDQQGNGFISLRAANGETFPACLVQSEKTGRGGGLVYSRSLVIKGMSPRRKTETQAGGSPKDSRLHWLFDEAPVGIALLDLSGNVVDCNRAFMKLLGRHREAVVGRPFAERISLEDQGDVGAQLSKVVMGTSRAAALDVRMPGAGERELVASLYISRMEDEFGEVSGLILHFIDTTEQKNLEIQFAQSQKIQAVGQLAGGVAHDFNNLLTAMIGFCDLLLERHRSGDPSFADIMQIKQNANRATNLVRQLLAFSRKQTLRPVALDLTAALSDLRNLLGRLIGENIQLRIAHGSSFGMVRVDPGQFDQVIINLAVNARDAMTGGGTLTIETSDVEIEEAVQRGHDVMPAGAYVRIDVVDTGSGIAKEYMAHIFEPFFSTKEVGAGTGLGLSTVYGIVRQTGGFIFVDSAPGQGTTFSIFLPHEEEEAEAADAAQPEKPLPPAQRDLLETDLTGVGTVVLVEDEDPVRMFSARALRNKGYNVLEACDGENALEVINGNGGAIDLVISDVVMPGMDGHTLAQMVRGELPDVKIILMSGYAEDALSDEIARDPTIHFLPKPFSLKGLAGKVKEVMEG